MIYEQYWLKIVCQLNMFLKPILCTSVRLTDTRHNVKTERINQLKVLTGFNASPPTSSTTVQERRDTEDGGGSQISNFNSIHFPVTELEYIIMMGKHKKHLLVKYHHLRCSQIRYYLAIAKLHKPRCSMRIVRWICHWNVKTVTLNDLEQ